MSQTELQIGPMPPGARELGFRDGSQNYRVYDLLLYRHHHSDTERSKVPLIDIGRIVPGGVTRRIDDIRKKLQPDKTLRGKVGWYVDNDVKSIYNPVLQKNEKHSWYWLVYLPGNPIKVLRKAWGDAGFKMDEEAFDEVERIYREKPMKFTAVYTPNKGAER